MADKIERTGQRTVEITLAEYNELLRATEKIEAVKRLSVTRDYISTANVLAVLDLQSNNEKGVIE